MKILNDSQLDRISEIISNLGLIFFISIVFPIFVDQARDITVFYLGLSFSVIIWLISIIILKEVKND